MPNATYKIESLSIEGFKAFTKCQSFNFAGRHVFLFGPNGFGKTSLVEAIRWCLFGLATRQGEIIKNQFYDGPCRVKVTLSAADGQWTMQRRLRPASGESDITINDPSGSDRNLEDVFPQLSQIGSKEGAHVIYAAQNPSSRRPEAHITEFSYVLYRYLGLEEVPRVCEVLLALSKDWQNQEDEVCQEVESVGEMLTQQIAAVDNELGKIITSPPWGDKLTPNHSQTLDKINQLAKDAETLSVELSSHELDGRPPREKLLEIETAVDAHFESKLTRSEGSLSKEKERLEIIESLFDDGKLAQHTLKQQLKIQEELQIRLNSVLNNSNLDTLERRLFDAEADLEVAQLKVNVVRSSLKFLNAVGDSVDCHVCPACHSAIQADNLKSQLEHSAASFDTCVTESQVQQEQLRNLINDVKQLMAETSKVEFEIERSKSELNNIFHRATELLSIPRPAGIEELQKYLDKHREDSQVSQGEIESQKEMLSLWRSQISDLHDELRFHELRSTKGRLQRLHELRYVPLHDELLELAHLRDIADNTRSQLNSLLLKKLNEDLPPVETEMTNVYRRLTGNPIFDSITIRPCSSADDSMTLDLWLSSSRGPGSWRVRQEILNGQAHNALQLVPYFVFSRYQEGPLLDLLLLDDPTQAFDTDRTNLLLTELASVTSHATLVLATHEEERFLPILKQLFPPDDLMLYRAVKLNEDGPHFEHISISL